jgi:hypothetical protein
MASYSKSFYPPAEIPKRHLPWFSRLMMAFAVVVLAALIYAFYNMAAAPMPKLDVPAQDAPARAPASPANPSR